MARDIVCVKIDSEKYNYEEAEMIMQSLYDQIDDEYLLIGIINGVEVECLNNNDKIINIAGKTYTYEEMIKLFDEKGIKNKE